MQNSTFTAKGDHIAWSQQLCYQLSPVIGALQPSVVFGYKYILLIFGIFLTYETRRVRLKVKQVNDSRFVGMSIYNVAVLCVNTTPFSNQENTTFYFVSLAIALCSFMSMGLIIVLEMEHRVKEPNQKLKEKPENLLTCNSTITSTTLSTGQGTNTTTTPAVADER
ncbi:hypothetical protein RRG08_051573 [Elysia crispata]|uniref:G-protein coupled receptors family 3 profile domain-containing protein n=1 Tax=Elysia crispata TaxID=231223 RepID=A0AAE0ZGZ4_9GAST|nr:hypothetical protein RRG08_051573 [Elysia crispata]